MKRIALLVTLLAAGLVGCSDDDTNDNNNNTPQEFSAVTFNGGLARGFVPLADARAQIIADAVAELDVDVICLQEIWQPEHVDMVQAAAADTFPNQIFLEPMPDLNPGDPACSPDATEVQAMETCARDNCGTALPDDLVDCVLGHCLLQFTSLTPECQSCIAANVSGTIDDTFNACAVSSEAYAYGGAFGIGLLTNETVTTSDSSVFASTFNRRAVIHAELETEALGTVHVFCTHLTAVFSSIPWPKPEGSWEAEQLAQVVAIRDYVDTMAGADGVVILMGDFNSGPDGNGYVADVEDNYNALVEGYTSVYPEEPDATCTFCDLNPLNGGIDHDESVLIDHILLRSFTGTYDADRILTEPITITVDGTPIETAYSDHYGVQVTMHP
ncbi:MAG: endonuclease/exonuclease/phosphatase family protein [bacterium]